MGKTADGQAPKGKGPTRFSLSTKSSIGTSVEEDDDALDISDAASSPPFTEHAHQLEPMCSRSTRPQLSQIKISVTISPDAEATVTTPAGHGCSSATPEESPSSIAYTTISQLPSSSNHRSIQPSNAAERQPAAYSNTSRRSTRKASLKRRSSKTLPAHPRTNSRHRSATSTWTPSSSPTRIQVTSTQRTDFDRFMKIFHPAPASRIPIPIAWRHISPRARSLREPSSPLRRVASIRVKPHKTVVRKRSQSARPNSALLLQAIAARPVSHFPVPRRPSIKRTNSQVTVKRHVANATLGRRSSRAAGTRLKRQKTLPLDWRLDKSLYMGSEDVPPIPVLSGSARSRFFPPQTPNDPPASSSAKGDVCDKVSTGVEADAMDDDDDGWESEVSGNEVWFDASDVAVVDCSSN
jgi:hypothetical protein